MDLNGNESTGVSVLDRSFKNVTHLFTHLDHIYTRKRRPRPVHATIIIPRENNSVSDIQDYAGTRKLTFEISPLGENLYRAVVGIRTSRERGVILENPEWWVFISDGAGSDLRRVLVESFIGRNMFRYLQAAYLTPDAFLDLADSLSSHHDSMVIDEASFSGEKATVRQWNKRPLLYARNDALQLQQC